MDRMASDFGLTKYRAVYYCKDFEVRFSATDPRIKSPLLYRLSYRPHCQTHKYSTDQACELCQLDSPNANLGVSK